MEYWALHTSPSLLEGDEVLVASQAGVALYNGDEKTRWRNGKLLLTTHHIFYQSLDDNSTLRLPLESIARAGQPPSTSKGFVFSSDKLTIPLPGGTFARISFRQGGMGEFYSTLEKVLLRKSWRTPAPTTATTATAEAALQSRTVSPSSGSAHATAPRTANMIGIAGVVKASEESSRMNNTFEDIDDVMLKASTLVQNVRQLRERATASSRSGDRADEETMALESIEATLGLGTMVSATGSSGSQKHFYNELAAEMHAWMTHPRNERVFGDMPHVPLIELFSLYNRARSGDFVSPEDVLMACKAMQKQSQARYRLETLSSGRLALVNKDVSLLLFKLVPFLGPQLINPKTHTEEKQAVKTVPTTRKFPASAHELKSVNAIQFARVLRVTVTVATDVLSNLTMGGYLCEAEVGYGCSVYYWNVFVF